MERCAIVGIGQTEHRAKRQDVSITGLVRIGEAFRQIHERGKRRVLAHASSGPCLQQNLVCVLEADA